MDLEHYNWSRASSVATGEVAGLQRAVIFTFSQSLQQNPSQYLPLVSGHRVGDRRNPLVKTRTESLRQFYDFCRVDQSFDFAQVIVGRAPQLASRSSFRILNETNPNFPHRT